MNIGEPQDNRQKHASRSVRGVPMRLHLARASQLAVDLTVLAAAIAIGFLLRFEFELTYQSFKLLALTSPYIVLLQYLSLVFSGATRTSWRYVSTPDAVRIGMALAIVCLVLVALRLAFGGSGAPTQFLAVPLSIIAIDFSLAFLGICGVRVLRRLIAERARRLHREKTAGPLLRTLLVGAGSAGVHLAREIRQRPGLGLRLVGFVDDDKLKVGTKIEGAPVLGTTSEIYKTVQGSEIELVLITIASANSKTIRRIVENCEGIDADVKILPSIHEILDGRFALDGFREVRIEDLVGRETVSIDQETLGALVAGKSVIVTGAGGSIGSELCRQVARLGPSSLVLVERAENALFQIHRELVHRFPGQELLPCVGDVTDADRMNQIFEAHPNAVVFHAAAHKHVPMMEWNPGEAIKNNIIGTRVVLDAASRAKASRFVLVSSDKAVRPTSVMGASKRIAERLVQYAAAYSEMHCVVVRFGNVLGSAGSVVPIFREQIAKGGPVTVTHPEMVRYFMTISEACQLVIQAAATDAAGEILVLDMGEPVKIVDLARDMIRLSGFDEEQIPIRFTGVRPGEKLFEELHLDSEQVAPTEHPKILLLTSDGRIPGEIHTQIDTLVDVARSADADEVRASIQNFVAMLETPVACDSSEENVLEFEQPRATG